MNALDTHCYLLAPIHLPQNFRQKINNFLEIKGISDCYTFANLKTGKK